MLDILVMEALPRGIGVFFQSELSAMINTLNTYHPLCFQKMWTTWHRKKIICICHKRMHFQPLSEARVYQILLEDGLSDPNCPFLLFLPAQIVIWERITYIYKENNLSEMGNCSEIQTQLFPYVLSFWVILVLRRDGQISFSQQFSEPFGRVWEAKSCYEHAWGSHLAEK